jgi:DNA-binding response OmpR family regulator
MTDTVNQGKKLKRIMYVDDDPDLQQIVKMGLEIGGNFNVKVCASGYQALEEIEEYKPDLVILDVVMPFISGPKTLEAIRKMDAVATVPVIFLTSKIQPTQLAHYESLGAIGVIRKPLNPMKLSAQVLEIWQDFHKNNK